MTKMDIAYKLLKTDEHGLEYRRIRAMDRMCLVIQGDRRAQRRISQGFKSARLFYPDARDHVLEPISCEERDGVVSAAYGSGDIILMEEFLRGADALWQYVMGKRAGRALLQAHTHAVDERLTKRAALRQKRSIDRIAEYLSSLPHVEHDEAAVSAISRRQDHLRLYKAVMRYGAFRIDNLAVSAEDRVVKLLPSPAYGMGDLSEDFVLLECEDAGRYPLFCAGVIDAYFSQNVPPQFWLQYAMQCALYSVWRCGRRIRKCPAARGAMQAQSDRICADFRSFSRPVPAWYGGDGLLEVRDQALRRGL
ncbi:MAG: hypothetical protein K6A65_03540 [Succinivibrionaceae bacterium]|nr:hypothetical protein [Succinivibrionaceae bacterium]